MASEKTTELQLNIWKPTDNVSMTEFNENFQKIDSGIVATEQKIDNEIQQVTQQLAQIPNQTYITEKAKTTDVNNALDLVDVQLNNKRDKSVLLSLNDADSEFVSAITGGTTVNITSIPKDYSVHPEKTTFIEKSSNLLNEYEYTNGIVIGADGIETANVSFQTTRLKPIASNKQITLFGVNYFSEYTDGGEFIKRNTLPVTTNEPSTITTSANTAYYRASFKNVLESSYNGKRQINYGATLFSYEPFYERLKIDIKSLNPSSMGDKIIEKRMLKDDVLPPNSNFGATLVGDAENLNFDFTNSQLVVKGSLVRLLHRDTSYLLNAQTLTLSSATTWQKIVYNLDTMLLEQVANNAILSKNQVYVCSYRKSTRQVVGVQSYYVNGSPVTNTGGGSNVPSLDIDVNTYDLKTIVNETTSKAFYDAKTYPGKSDLYSMYKDDFYALFDTLMAQYPNNITRTQWGLDYNGDPIYYYESKPYDTRNSVSEPFSKMILISGMHGWEKTGIYTLYLTLKDIYDNNETDEHLNMLYSNVHFIVAPCCNHYGMANNIRKNENGIDPSRNFSAGFVAGTNPSSSVYSGTSAFSEISSQFVKSLIDAHTDAVYFGSFHNFKLEDGATYNSFIWNASATPMQVTLGKHHVKEMTHKWRQEFAWFPTNLDYFTGYADLSAPGGSEAMYAVSKGIQASTYEVCEGHNAETGVTRFNATTWHLSTECFTNWLVLNLRKNVEFYNRKTMLI